MNEVAEFLGNNPGMEPPQGPLTKAFDLFLQSPSDEAFIHRSESFLLSSNKRALEQMQKREKKKQDEKEKREQRDKAK